MVDAKLEDAIRRVLRRAADDLCARQVAERVTIDTGSEFGECGPETHDVETALLTMRDVVRDFDDEDESSDGEVYRLRDAAKGGAK